MLWALSCDTGATCRPTLKVPMHPADHVACGPTAGTDWCVLADPDPAHVAPGGVVLCQEGTLEPHPDAARAARAARVILWRWQSERSGA